MKKLIALIVAAWLTGGGAAVAQETEPARYLLRLVKESNRDRVYKTYGLTEIKNIAWLYNLHVVTGPPNVDPATLVAKVRADRNVRTFELDAVASTGEMAAAHPDIKQSTQTLDQALAVDRTLVDFEGTSAWAGYVRQPAFDVIQVEAARTAGQKGEGLIIAVIDSGIDPDHPVLRDVLLPGYDFTRNQDGASEWLDLDPAVAQAIQSDPCGSLDQSTAAIMDQSTAAIMDQSTAAIMDGCNAAVVTQSTAAIMDSDTVQQLGSAPVPADFGHGTMVAGLVHAVAPKAKILPIKAFRADGTGRASDIAQAIYYAYLSGARVINMSFTFATMSNEVMYATAYAALSGAIPVGASGNQGLLTRRWPAEHKWVVGVCSTTLTDQKSTFSNQGYDTVKICAPGENLITTYPGNHYASVSGTSFSAALVSGSVALMGKAAPRLEWGATRDVVYKGSYAAVAGIVRDASNVYPQRLIVPPAIQLAPVYERDEVKQINGIK